MLVPPTAIVQTRHMEVTPVTATIIIITQSIVILTFRMDARHNKVLPACFSRKPEHI